MRALIDIITEAANLPEKIERNAFIYMAPKPPAEQFAQCETCLHFIPDHRCGIFSEKDRVKANASCGLYLHGTPSDKTCRSIVTPEEAGYVDGAVRCQNCSWFDDGECGLFKTLMEQLPEVFSLDTKVDEHGCCNAFQAK
jgi:hypothetical protein